MKHIKSIIITAVCFCASKLAYTQNVAEYMYVKSDSLLSIYAKDTLYASPDWRGPIILKNKQGDTALVLGYWPNTILILPKKSV